MFTSKQALLLVTEVLCVILPFPFQLHYMCCFCASTYEQTTKQTGRAHLELTTQQMICRL